MDLQPKFLVKIEEANRNHLLHLFLPFLYKNPICKSHFLLYHNCVFNRCQTSMIHYLDVATTASSVSVDGSVHVLYDSPKNI